MRDFYQVRGSDAEVVHVFVARTARCAAMKAATKGGDVACIVDPRLRKLHVYTTGMRELEDHELTDFARRHSISQKPVVAKIAYSRLPAGLPLGRERWDARAVRAAAEHVLSAVE